MKQSTKKTYYEILNVSPDASIQEVEEAFNTAKKVYGEESVAVYSLYSSHESKELLSQIEDAYETLKDPKSRSEYDASLNGSAPKAPVSVPSREPAGNAIAQEVAELKESIHYSIRFKSPLAVMDDKKQHIAEQYRILFTRLEQLGSNGTRAKVFCITSAVKGEGKTTTSLNLAYEIASGFKKKVALVECDLKCPSLSSYFQDNGEGVGLVDIVNEDTDVNAAATRVDKTNLYIIPAGRVLKNSSEVLGSPDFLDVIDKLRKRFDYVFLDSPPILPLADMSLLTRAVDGLVLVVKAGKTPKDLVLKAVKSLPGATFAGIVLNDSDSQQSRHYYY